MLKLIGKGLLFLAMATGLGQAQVEVFSEPVSTVGAAEISPLVAEVDGNLSNGKELVLAKADGTIAVMGMSGALRWTAQAPNYTCSGTSASNKMKSSPAVADLDGDGTVEVVFGYGGIDQNACSGGVVALNGATGEQLWHFNVDKQKNNERLSAVFGTPGIADVNGDGLSEVCFGAHDRNIYCVSAQGKLEFLYHAADTVFSSPAFADIDGDGAHEMVMGTDISENKFMEIEDGGFLYAFNIPVSNKRVSRQRRLRNCKKIKKRKKRRRCKKRNRKAKKKAREPSQSGGSKGSSQVEFGFRDESAFLWTRAFDQTIQSSAVLADLVPDKPGLEVAVGTGCFFPQGSSNKRGKWIKVLRAKNGKEIATLQTDTCMRSSPAVGDLNGDGLKELVVLQGGDFPRVIAWTPALNSVLWTAEMTDSGLGNHGRQAVIADLDGNGSLEVVFGNRGGVRILAGDTGAELSNLKVGSGTVSSTPVVADMDGDGKPEVAASAKNVAVWTGFDSLGSAVGLQAPFAAPFPMWRGTPARTGVLE